MSMLAEAARVAAEHRKRMAAQADRLNQIALEHAARRTRLEPIDRRLAPKRVSCPAVQPMPEQPDTFVADIASRLRHF